MSTFDSQKLEEDFIEAKQNWELEKLYVDLASAKGKALTPVEKKFLRGLLCGYSPAEIANTVYQSRSSSTVRVYLSNGLYKYLEEMLSIYNGYSVKVKNWSRVTQLLERAGYKKSWLEIESAETTNRDTTQETDVVSMKPTQKYNWGSAVDISVFHGRTAELTSIKKWIIQERCRLIVILGMGGIGKTAFSVKLAQQIGSDTTLSEQDKFDCVIWRSLRLAPHIDVILNQILQILSPLHQPKSVETTEGKISHLMDCLRSVRCLIVLDGIDTILCNEFSDEEQIGVDNLEILQGVKNYRDYLTPQIRYRPNYESYGELIRRLGESQHQSCLVLTSREKPQEIAALEGDTSPVRSLKLTGLNKKESALILQAKGLVNTESSQVDTLLNLYGGNPLF